MLGWWDIKYIYIYILRYIDNGAHTKTSKEVFKSSINDSGAHTKSSKRSF